MAIAQSKITAQGQISVPADILEWEEEGDKIVVRRAGRFSSEDIHRALFGKQRPQPQSLNDLKEGVRRYARKRYPRG